MSIFVVTVILQGLQGREPTYRPDWQSIATHQIPEWLADDKFGIFIHWMPNSVPAFHDEWYARLMYMEGHPVFEHHRNEWGDQSEFGYKDFIPLFTADQWDPDEWVAFLKESGARFIVPNAEHHDHFALWDSDLTRWNSVEMGPKRDIVGDLAKATRKAGLRFGVSNHRARGWNFYTYKPAFDTTDPKYADFYWPQYGKEPDPEWLTDWLNRLYELVDKYKPDLIWFDFGWGLRNPVFEPYQKEFAAYYYNQADAWGKQVCIIYKGDDLPKGVGLLDVERGKLDRLWPVLWMTDTTVFEDTWGYVEGAPLKSVDLLLHDFIDIVSKNGTLLLNIGPKADGTIPNDQREVLHQIGAWLKANGDAIYGTRPFLAYKDGEAIRYTRKANNVYAISLQRPEGPILLREMTESKLGGLQVESVRLLNGGAEVEWSTGPEGLTIIPPSDLPGIRAWVFAVRLKGLGFDKPSVRLEHRVEGIAVFAHGDVHNFTDEVQVVNARVFLNGSRQGSVSRVKIPPGESANVLFEHRDQNHYGAKHLLLTGTESSVNTVAIGREKPESDTAVFAFPAIPMIGTWQFHEGDDTLWRETNYDDSEWQKTIVPGRWPLGNNTQGKTGTFRRTVTIPNKWEGRNLYMNLGIIRDEDTVWVNGEQVGKKPYEEVEFHTAFEIRKYRIPATAIHFGEKNVITVRVTDHEGRAGLVGPPGFITVAE
ncbi:MAG: alpha-L-fucosidase [Verrucomicrobiota bacterium]